MNRTDRRTIRKVTTTLRRRMSQTARVRPLSNRGS
jgi:hypothetical protein